MNRSLASIAGMLLLAMASCSSTPGKDPTQILAVIDAEPGVREQMTSLDWSVRGLSPDAPEPRSERLKVSSQDLVLPYTLALVPKDGDETRRFEVVVTARDEDDAVVAVARAQSHYVAQRKLQLPLLLRDSCIGVTICTTTQTCDAGQCVSATVDPTTLAPFPGSEPPKSMILKPVGGSGGTGGTGGTGGSDSCPLCPCTPGDTRLCGGTTTGACERGIQTCGSDSRWQEECVGAISGSPEICNNVDDDCNGNVDDAIPPADLCNPSDLPNTRVATCDKTCKPVECEEGWKDCDMNPATGCEKSLTSVNSCGDCNMPCDIDNALESCESGECRVVECDADWKDCDTDFVSCETPINTYDDCGDCGQPCELDNASEQCLGTPGNRVCTLYQCDNGFDDCDEQDATGCEIDLETDAQNCGACDNDCTTKPNVDSGSCAAGTCDVVCATHFIDCDGDPDNGCEVDLRVAPCPTCFDDNNTSNVDVSQYNFGGTSGVSAVDLSCGTMGSPVTHVFDSSTGQWSPSDCCGGACPLPAAPLATQSGAPSILVLRSLNLNVGPYNTVRLVGQYPVLLAVLGNATIAGTIDASASGDVPGAGGNASACGTTGTSGNNVATGQAGVQQGGTASSGGGGGGFGKGTTPTPAGVSAGGLGGASPSVSRTGGATLADADLSPLYGGCSGGIGHASAACSQTAGAGGGAIQMAVAGKLTLTGSVLANGGTAPAACVSAVGQRSAGSGGGSGGGILLEAVEFSFDVDDLDVYARANGGAGSEPNVAGIAISSTSGGAGSTSSGVNGTVGGYASPAGAGGGGGYGRVAMRSCMP